MATVTAQETERIPSILSADDRFSTLVTAAVAADLVDVLDGDGPFTVFAPTDAAFAKLPPETLASLLLPENQATLRNILLYHVVAGNVPSETVVTLTQATTLAGANVNVIVRDGSVSVNNAAVVQTDIGAANGIVHVIDTVLIPPSNPETRPLAEVLTADGRFTTLLAAVGAAELVEALGGEDPLTLLAPTDAAFAKLPPETLASLLLPENQATLRNILLYHVVAGAVPSETVVTLTQATTLAGLPILISVEEGVVQINGSLVTSVDIGAGNGIIHAIDTVLLPETRNLVEVLTDRGGFETVLTAAAAADLAMTLSEGGPFTLFAPTDAAFAALPEGVVADLLLPENQAALASILLYHVVPGIVPAADVVRSSTLRAASGRILEVNVTEEGVFINKSRIEVVNLLASNGLIHVIEAVLLPGQVIQVESLVRTGDEIRVTWSGGLPPYRVERTLEIDGEWSTVAETSDTHVDLPVEGSTGFFRVVGDVE